MEGRRLKVQVTPGTTPEPFGQCLLGQGAGRRTGRHDSVKHLAVGLADLRPFRAAVDASALAYSQDTPLPFHHRFVVVASSKHPAGHFSRANPRAASTSAGRQAFNWGEPDFNGSTVLDLWNFHGKTQLIDQGVPKANQVTLDDLKFDGEEPGVDGMTRKHRQWYVCQPAWPGGGEYYFDGEGYLKCKGWMEVPFALHRL